MTSYSAEISPSSVNVSSGTTGLALRRSLSATKSSITVNSSTTNLRVSNGVATLAVSSVAVGSGYFEARSSDIVVFATPTSFVRESFDTYTYPGQGDVQFKLNRYYSYNWGGSPSFPTGGVSSSGEQLNTIGYGRSITLHNFGTFSLAIPGGPSQSYTIPDVYVSVVKADGTTYNYGLFSGGTSETVPGFSMRYTRTVELRNLYQNDVDVIASLIVAEFPTYKPTTREFTPPSYANSKTYAMNNRSSRLLIASKPGQATLALGYENVYDSLANDFINVYNECQGSIKPVVIHQDFLSGLSTELKNYVQLYGSTLSWRWDGPPVIESVKRGVVNVRVRFKASTTYKQVSTAPGVASGIYVPTDYVDTTRYLSFT